jgi:hypothetical protein
MCVKWVLKKSPNIEIFWFLRVNERGSLHPKRNKKNILNLEGSAQLISMSHTILCNGTLCDAWIWRTVTPKAAGITWIRTHLRWRQGKLHLVLRKNMISLSTPDLARCKARLDQVPYLGAKAPIVLYPAHEGHIQLEKSQFKFQLLSCKAFLFCLCRSL